MTARPEIISHTSLRGVAALLVVIFHFRSFLHSSIGIDSLTSVFMKGYLWVDFFFMLSGFILCYVYLKESDAPRESKKIMHFLTARFARIYPLHLVTLIAVVTIYAMQGAYSLLQDDTFCCLVDGQYRTFSSLGANLFLVQSWSFFSVPTWNIPSWSISAELACYLSFAVYLWVGSRPSRLLNILIPVGGLILYIYMFLHSTNIDEPFELSAVRALAGFSIGIGLYHFRNFERIMPEKLVSLGQIGAFLFLITLMHLGASDFSILPLMPFIILLCASDRGLIAKLLSNRSLYLLGLYSYSIYLWHYPIKFLALKDWGKFFGVSVFDGAAGSVFFLTGLIVVVLAVSVLSHKYIEVPGRRLLTKMST